MRFLLLVIIGISALCACGDTAENKTQTSIKKKNESPQSEARNSDSIEVIIKDSKTGEEKRQMVPKDVLTNPSTIKQPEQPIIEK
jgi:hypothetical protein